MQLLLMASRYFERAEELEQTGLKNGYADDHKRHQDGYYKRDHDLLEFRSPYSP
jgi:hypothetical protein